MARFHQVTFDREEDSRCKSIKAVNIIFIDMLATPFRQERNGRKCNGM